MLKLRAEAIHKVKSDSAPDQINQYYGLLHLMAAFATCLSNEFWVMKPMELGF